MSIFWKIIGGYTCSVLVSGARGKVWGSDEVNVEGWKALKRLPGHESGTSKCDFAYFCLAIAHEAVDVTDLAWSPGDRYLASVGLDSTVVIWCGFTLGTIEVFSKLMPY